MTTLEKISEDPAANFDFWTERAIFALHLYRQHRRDYPAIAKGNRMAFRRYIRSRRTKEYLTKAQS